MNQQRNRDQRIVAIRDIEPLDRQLKYVKVVSVCASLLFGIFGLIFAVMARTEINRAKVDFVNIIENWNSPFLFNLTAVADPINCPGNSTAITLGMWPGTKDGCDCRFISSFMAHLYEIYSYRLSQGSCSYNESRAGCYDIGSTPQTEFKRWKSFASFCGYSYRGINFASISDKFENDVDCLNGSIKCGVNLTHSVCLPSWVKECPISEIRLPQSRILQQLNGLNVQPTVLRNTSLPLVEFRTGWNNICYDNDQIRYPSKLSSYVLFSSGAVEECVKIDDRFKPVDTISHMSLLDLNYVPFRTLPIFREDIQISNPTQTLFTRNLIHWDLTCRIHLDSVIGHTNDVRMVASYQDSLLAATIVNFIFLTLLYPCLEVCLIILPNRNQGGIVRPFGILNLPSRQKWCMIVVGVIGWLSKIGQIIFFYLTMRLSSTVMDFFSLIASLKCSDKLTNDTFDHVDKILREDAYEHNKQGLYIELFFVAINVLAMVREAVLELTLKNRFDILEAQNAERNIIELQRDNDQDDRITERQRII